MKLLRRKAFISGVSQTLVLSPAGGYVRPDRSGPKSDVRLLRADGTKIQRDLNGVYRRRGQSVDNG